MRLFSWRRLTNNPRFTLCNLCRLLASVTVACCLAASALALDPGKTLTQYAHRVWGQEEGLFQPTIYSILQTRDGFLWLGTQDSLIRFDGMHFREFHDGNSVLHRSLIHALLEDQRGNLWVGASGGGVARIDPNGSVKQYTAKDGIPSPNVFCLASDSKGAIWVCTERGLARIADGAVQTFTHAQGLPTDRVRATCEATDGTRWVAGLDFGLSRWIGSRFESYTDHVIGAGPFSALLCSEDGSVWVGGQGVAQITRSGSRLFTTRDGLPDNQVSSLAQSHDGSVWAGSDDGISRIRDNEVSVYRTRDGLSHSVVLSLYVDREGSLWAGTKDGLDQFTDGNVTPYTTNEGLLSNDSGPVIEDARGRLWIGTLGRGLNWFDGHQFGAITTRNGLVGNAVLSLAYDANDDVWVGTNSGITRLRNGVPVRSYTTADGLSGHQVRALLVDNTGALWAGTEDGLDRFDGRRFRHADFLPQITPGGIVALSGGRNVRLFASVATPALYVLRNDHPAGYHFDISHPVDCYYLDHVRHTVWMGTLGSGLLRWKDGAITHVHVKDGLYDNRIYGILSDDHANFWLASSKGIFRVSIHDLEDFADGKTRFVTSIPFSTGQLRFECRSGVQPAAWRAHDGRLWFSTNNGLVAIDPDHLRIDSIPPPVAITAVLVNGQRIELPRQLVLKPWQTNNVEIRYAGLSFVSPEKVTFRYRLEGFDKDWTDAGTRRQAFFTNLPPGQFRFEVMARNADGVWSEQVGTLPLQVEPRMYQRWWFFPALAGLLGLAAAAWYRLRIRRLKQRFELILAERNRIARELHDTLLQGLAGIAMQMQALWTRLPASKEKSFLGDIIQDAGQCASEARQSLWGLRTRGQDRFEFSEKLENSAKKAVREAPVTLALNIDRVSLRDMPEAEFQLLRIAQEAISNVVKHANAIRLRVDLELRDGTLRLTVEDDGVGFDTHEEALPGHFGVMGMRERARQIGAELDIETSTAGTKVSVSLVLGRGTTPERNTERVAEHQTV
jgi:signal transduction histidine kinase/ligand-binding sensor domain-containing protein